MPKERVKLYPCFEPLPYKILASWLVWNAPHPVYGSEIDGDKTQVDWRGKPWHGVHYAATTPRDPDFGLRNRKNIEAGGWVLKFVDPAAARSEATQYLISESGNDTTPAAGQDLTELGQERYLLGVYRALHESDIIEVEVDRSPENVALQQRRSRVEELHQQGTRRHGHNWLEASIWAKQAAQDQGCDVEDNELLITAVALAVLDATANNGG